jgi:hypothetical protein
LLSRSRTPVRDVFANGRRKKKRVLQNDPDLLAQRFLSDLTEIASIQGNRADGWIIETRDQTQKSAFAGAGAAD